MKDGKPFLALGTPGAMYIQGNIFTTLLNIVAFNMDLKTAIESPRFNSLNDGKWIFEQALYNSTEFLDQFKSQGIPLTQISPDNLSGRGAINAVQLKSDSTVDAFADFRRSGYADYV